MLLIFDTGDVDKLTPFHYFCPEIDRENNSRIGHSIIAREIVLKRRRDFCGGKAILARLTSPEAGFRCFIFITSASRLWPPFSVTTAVKGRRRMTSAGRPPALLPVYTVTQVLAQPRRLPTLGPQVARAISSTAEQNAVSGVNDSTARQPAGVGKETQPLPTWRQRVHFVLNIRITGGSIDSIRKRQFAAFKTQHADVLASSKANLALPADFEEQWRAPTPLQKNRARCWPRGNLGCMCMALSQEGKDPPDARH